MTGPDGGIRFRRSPEALSRRVGTDVLVTVPGQAEVQELSGGAHAVWADLATPRTLSELVDRLATEHDVEPDDIAGEVRACVGRLRILGVVEEMTDLHE